MLGSKGYDSIQMVYCQKVRVLIIVIFEKH